MRIRAAVAGDMDALLSLEKACYPPREAYGRAEYAHALRRAHAVNLVAEDAGRVVGFAGAFLHDGPRIGHVFTLNVHPDARRAGLGRRLLGEVERAMAAAGMRTAVLEVGVRNKPAQALYAGAGYEVFEKAPRYYATGEDALRMAKRLTGGGVPRR